MQNIHYIYIHTYIYIYNIIPVYPFLIARTRPPIPFLLQSLVPFLRVGMFRQGAPLHAVETGWKRHDVLRVDPCLQDVQQLVPVRIAPWTLKRSVLQIGMDQYTYENTIFSGMNIHLPAILIWTTGVQGFDTLPNHDKERQKICIEWFMNDS